MNSRRFVLVVVVALGTAGCDKVRQKAFALFNEKIAEKAVERETGQKADLQQSGEKIVVATDAGPVTLTIGPSVRVPDDFPAGVPVYPGSTLDSAMTSGDAPHQGHTLVFHTADPPEKVAAFYTSTFQRDNQTVDMKAGGMRTMTFRDARDHVEVALTIETNKPGAAVRLVTSPLKR